MFQTYPCELIVIVNFIALVTVVIHATTNVIEETTTNLSVTNVIENGGQMLHKQKEDQIAVQGKFAMIGIIAITLVTRTQTFALMELH